MLKLPGSHCTIWPLSSWSVYKQSVRSNNNVEGWHNGLNRRAEGKVSLPLYMLIELLYQESRSTALQIGLVSEKKLRRIQRREYRFKGESLPSGINMTAARRRENSCWEPDLTYGLVWNNKIAFSFPRTAALRRGRFERLIWGATNLYKPMTNNEN